MIIFWNIWNAIFSFLDKQNRVVRYLHVFFLRNIRKKYYFKLSDLHPFENFIFMYFYRSAGFGSVSYFFIDWNKPFYERLKNYKNIYTNIVRRVIKKESTEEKNLTDIGLNYKHYLKFKRKNIKNIKKFLKMNYVVMKDYYFFNNYFNNYYFNIVGDYSQFETKALSVFVYVSMYNRRFKKGIYLYSTHKINDFYRFFKLSKKKRYKLFKSDRTKMEEYKRKYLYKVLVMKIAYNDLYKNYFNINFGLLSPKMLRAMNYKNKNDNLFLFNSEKKKEIDKKKKINFNVADVSKFLLPEKIENLVVYFIRKNKIFNKGRYSRNRQLYRTGVYWCLWLNIIIVYGLYYFFYRFTFNFGYLWIGLGIYLLSFVFSRAVQHKFYSLSTIINEFYAFFNWFLSFFDSILENIAKTYEVLLNFYNIFDVSSFLFKIRNVIVFLDEIVLRNITPDYIESNKSKFIYSWEYLNERDKTIFKIKTISNWFSQVDKMMLQ